MNGQLALVEQPFSSDRESYLKMRLTSVSEAEGEETLRNPGFQTLVGASQSPELGPFSYLLFAGKLQAMTAQPLELGSRLSVEIEAGPQAPVQALALVVRQFPAQRNGMHISALRFIGLASPAHEKASPIPEAG